MTLRTLLPLMAALLGGCSSVLMTSDGASPGDNLMYAGTRFNAKVIGQDSCEQSGYNAGYSCAYQQLLTPLCLFDFDRERGRFRLRSIHPGHTLEEVLDQTGFEFDRPERVATTPSADAATLDILYGPVRTALASGYPAFAESMVAATAGFDRPHATRVARSAMGKLT